MKRQSILFKTVLMLCLFVGITHIQAQAQKQLKPVAFYLKNLPAERIGEYSDTQIKTSLEADNFIVIEVDCSTFPVTSPELEEALVKYHIETPTLLDSYEDENTEIDYKTIFYVPEGYTITRNIPVWSIKDHGAEGSMERVMKIFNDVIAPKNGLATVSSPDELVEPDGSPVNWNLHIDIVHPSGKATKEVPLLLNFSSNSPRQAPFKPNAATQIVYRNIFPFGFLTTGYAFATADHCYNPLARGESYGYIDQYTLEDWNGLAAVTAYIRYLKGHSAQYNLNSKIGVMGISKASYSAVRIADINNATGDEYFTFNNTPNTKPQPWPGIESTVDVAYAAAGNGTRRVPKYVNEHTVPMITSVGAKDEYNQWPVYPEVVKHFQDIDQIHLSLWMEELGHTYPGMGIDLATGENRYVIFKRFFDHYLKPNAETTKDVFYILPKENSTEVDTKGYSRILAPDGMLPTAMLGLSAYSPITVRFLSEYTISEIAESVKIFSRVTNEEIIGTWTASMGNTTFSFEPAAELTKDAIYQIEISTNINMGKTKTDKADIIREFIVTKNAEAESEDGEIKKVYPIDDTYTATAKNTKAKGAEKQLRVRYSSLGDWRFDAYLKFDISELKENELKSAKIKLAPSSSVGESINLHFYKTNVEWNENELVSANKPTMESNYFDVQKINPSDSWIEADATSVLKDALSNNEQYLSIAIRVPSTEPSSVNAYFHSKEADTGSLHPYLAIEERISVGLSDINNNTINIEIKDQQIYYNGDNTLTTDIFDISGKKILGTKINKGEHISLSNLDRGIYLARFSELNTHMSIKIIL